MGYNDGYYLWIIGTIFEALFHSIIGTSLAWSYTFINAIKMTCMYIKIFDSKE